MRKLLLRHATIYRTFFEGEHVVYVWKIPYETDAIVDDIHMFMRDVERALFKYYIKKRKDCYTSIKAADFTPSSILVHVIHYPNIYP